jgi:hypothetical protein
VGTTPTWTKENNATMLAADSRFVTVLVDGDEEPRVLAWHMIKFEKPEPPLEQSKHTQACLGFHAGSGVGCTCGAEKKKTDPGPTDTFIAVFLFFLIFSVFSLLAWVNWRAI